MLWQKKCLRCTDSQQLGVRSLDRVKYGVSESSSEIVLFLVVVLVVETEDEDDWVHASSV
jgi:hypothetical protein